MALDAFVDDRPENCLDIAVESKAKVLLVWHGDLSQVPAGAKRLGVRAVSTINEAATVVQLGTADAATVDQIFQDCFGHAMGPLRTADLIGLDTIVDTLHVLLEFTGDSRFVPCDLLVKLVAAGQLGRKSGQGFYSY